MLSLATVVGTCNRMCPASEIAMREKCGALHPLEVDIGEGKPSYPLKDRSKIVKQFMRSAAGQNMQAPELLRPYPILLDTITHLLTEILAKEKYDIVVRYDFITDRLRAVRQDMIIQDFSNLKSICLLQPMVRFHVFASYRLCEEQEKYYDPYLNNKHLQECLKRLLVIYKTCEEVFMFLKEKQLDTIDYLVMHKKTRSQIEAIYILFNLGDDEAIYHALSLPANCRNSLDVQLALRISLSFRRKNFVRALRLIYQLPDLLAAAIIQHIPKIRVQCLQSMSVAYNSTNLTFPMVKLMELLLYSNRDDLIHDLKICKIAYSVEENRIHFLRHQFNNCKLPVRKEPFVKKKFMSLSPSDIILYGVD